MMLKFCGSALLLVAAMPASAVTFADPLTGAALNPALSLQTLDRAHYSVAYTGQGIAMSRAAGGPPAIGVLNVSSRFTFGGPFTVSIDVAGLDTGLDGGAESGLGVRSYVGHTGGAFADIFSFGNSSLRANNFLGVTFDIGSPAPGIDRLTISGDTGAQRYRFNFFLLQEFGGTAANDVIFSNLSLSAASLSVPEPASWALLIAGFGLTGAALRRRGAAMARS